MKCGVRRPEQLPDQGPALHLPEERRSSDTGGEGGAVSIGSAEPGHDPGDADPDEPATTVQMDAKTARRFLDRWNAWVQVCDLGPMKRLAKTIMGKAEGISDRSTPAFPTASSKPSTAMCQPPSAKPKATEPSEISKPSSTSSPVTSWPIHPLEIATSPTRVAASTTSL